MPNFPINAFIVLLAHPILNIALSSLGRKKNDKNNNKKPEAIVTESAPAPSFLIVNPQNGRKRDILKYFLTKNTKSIIGFFHSSDEEIKRGVEVDNNHRWNLLISIIICRFLAYIDTPLKYFGYLFEFILNLISQNGSVSGIFNNLLHVRLKLPRRGSANFLSSMGHFDGRIDLLSQQVDNSISTNMNNINSDLGNRYLMDLCIMASKLAYENKNVVKNVVERHWKMHFVDFYNCWNEYEKQRNTQVFIFCDKPKDANLIMVSFRGTETFSAQDWSTNFDFSWYEIPKVGKIHLGFLEALGLGDRRDTSTFHTHLQKKHTNFFNLIDQLEGIMLELFRKSAYFAVALKLKTLLKQHKNAKFVVTGHSLGGALAVLFPCILVLQEETEMLQRLQNIYTFGQPRIGDAQFGNFMESYLIFPATRYYRVVYCNDLVPRVPFDEKIFGYRHFGSCLYYDSLYFGQFVNEQPNRNFFGLKHFISMRINALWEIVRSCLISHFYGSDYEESWVSTMLRVIGVLVPGGAAHGPVDYVNSVRLGKERKSPMASLKSIAHKFSI